MFIINTVLEHIVVFNSPACFWLRLVFLAAHRLPLLAGSRGCSWLRALAPHCSGLSLQSTGSTSSGCSSWGVTEKQLQLEGSSAQTQYLWWTGSAAPRRVGFSQAREQTCVTCTSRQSLTSWITREVASTLFLLWKKLWYHCPFRNVPHHMEAKWIYYKKRKKS